MFRQILPEEFSAADDMSFTHREKLQGQTRTFAVVGKDIDIAFWRRRHLLLLGKLDYRLPQIAIFGRHLIAHFIGSLGHARRQSIGKLFVSAFQQESHITHRFLVLRGRAEAFDAWPKTTFDVIFETGTRRLPVDLNVAGSELKSSID